MTLQVPTPPVRTGSDYKDLDLLWEYVEYLALTVLPNALTSDEQKKAGVGGDVDTSDPVVIPPIDFGAPQIPQGLTAVGFVTEIGLTWQLIMDRTVIGYEIQRADDVNFTVNAKTLTQALALQYIDTHVTGTKFYRIRALRKQPDDATLVFSPFSPVVSASTVTEAQVLNQMATWGQKVQTTRLVNAIITNAQIQDLAVDSAKIADAAIITAKIANLAVVDAKILSLGVNKLTTGTLAVGSIFRVGPPGPSGVEAISIFDVAPSRGLIQVYDKQTPQQGRVFIGNLEGLLGAGVQNYGVFIFNAAGQVMLGVTGATTEGLAIDAVVSTRRQQVNAISGPWTLPAGTNGLFLVNHNLGRIPLAIITSGNAVAAATSSANSATQAFVIVVNLDTTNPFQSGTWTYYYW